MNTYTISFQEIDRSELMKVGGKGVNLGVLSRVVGIQVPDGFCITTEAYKKMTENNPEFNKLLDELAGVKADDRKNIIRISAKIADVIEKIPIPEEITNEIEVCFKKFDAHMPLPSALVLPQKICPQHLLRASRTAI